jgi:hypothetical protein
MWFNVLAVYGPVCGCMVHFVGPNLATHRAIYCQRIEPQHVTTTVVLAKYSELPEDGSMVNRNMSEPLTDF